MSNPASFVIIEGGVATVLRDKYGAFGVLYNFINPNQARDHALCGMETDWLDDCAEGGYLVDFDNKVGIVFGAKYESDGTSTDPRSAKIDSAIDNGSDSYLAHVSSGWPEWTLRWADVDEFEDHVKQNCATHPLS